MDQYERTRLLIGDEPLSRLWQARVAVFGVGGVGGYVVEALARAGIGHIDIIDNDEVAFSNLNRQIIATRECVGKAKVEVMKDRILSINPDIEVRTYQKFYLPENSSEFDFSSWDYIVDAIDTVTAKLDIISKALELHIPLISAMGCGNRVDPTKLVITDVYKTSGDPLAKIMRNELKKRGVHKLKVVYSTEAPIKPELKDGTSPKEGKRNIPGSTPFVPSSAGIMIAYQVCMDLTGFDADKKIKEQRLLKSAKKEK
jgi:tRNA A37 threonylcarbamoyladenosine dehydratase